MNEEMITITREEYDSLLDSQNILDCLQSAGVDNWDGYEEALEGYWEDGGDDE